MNVTQAKAKSVKAMFSSIARWYDFLNHFLSLGIDVRWRKRAVACFTDGFHEKKILDVACGTADLAIALARAGDQSVRVTGGDFSGEMIEVGESKIKKTGLGERVTLEIADALDLRFDDESFDGVTCAFGVRNFADLERGLSQMARVLKPGGRMVILEFTTPTNPIISAIYKLYFTRILPFVGGLVSGNRGAYEYLPDSVYKFPSPEKLKTIMETTGIGQVEIIPLTFGVSCVHTGVKR